MANCNLTNITGIENCTADFKWQVSADSYRMRIIAGLVAHAVYFIESTVAIIGNILVLVIFMKYPNQRIVRNYFVCSLSVADILTAISNYISCFTVYQRLSNTISETADRYTCGMILYLLSVANMSSLWSTVAISVDRYVQIIHGLRYAYFATSVRATAVIFSIWFFAVTFNMVAFRSVFEPQSLGVECMYYRFMDVPLRGATIVINTMPFVLVPVFYSRIFYVAYLQQRRIVPIQLPQTHNNSNSSSNNLRIVKMMAWVIGFLFVASALYLSVPYISRTDVFKKNSAVNSIFRFLALFFFLLNACVNPYIYHKHDKLFRRNLKHMMNIPQEDSNV